MEAGLITIEQILAGVPLVNNFYREIETKHPVARPQLIFNEALKRALDYFATDLIENTRRRVADAGVNSVDDVRHAEPPPADSKVRIVSQGAAPHQAAIHGTRARLAAFSPFARAASSQLKVFLFTILYNHPGIVEDRDRGVAALDELFRHYMKHPDAMPPFYTAEATQPSSAGGRPAHLVVLDYVAGMTDHFLLRTHRELIGK